MLSQAAYDRCIAQRRAFSWPGFATYADVKLDGAFVSPFHMSCGNLKGPVLISFNWLDAPTALREHGLLSRLGYLPQMLFNKVLDMALRRINLRRSDIYLTHAVHLLPPSRSAAIPQAATDASFDAITRHEIAGRPVIALGKVAAGACRRAGLPCTEVAHPSARGATAHAKAEKISEALRDL